MSAPAPALKDGAARVDSRCSLFPLVMLAFALAFSAIVRCRLAEMPLERDEGEFAYAGQLILRGVPPYQLAYNMKLPGTYLAYAGIMALFGPTAAGVHYGLLAVNLLTIGLLYRLTRDLLGPISAGGAAIAFSILSVSPSVLGTAAHATHFVALFGLAGACVLWRYCQTPRLLLVCASGLLFGIAFLMKQQGVFLIGFGGVSLLVLGLQAGGELRKGRLLALLGYSLAAVLPYLAVCAWLWHSGVWKSFVFWTIDYASHYVRAVPVSAAWTLFWRAGLGVIGANWPLWLLAWLGFAGLLRGKQVRPPAKWFLLGFLAFSVLCIVPGFFFREQYFIVVLPAVAMLAGVGAQDVWNLDGTSWIVRRMDRWWSSGGAVLDIERPPADSLTAGTPGKRKNAAPFARLGLAAVLLLTIALQWQFYFQWSPQEASRKIYGFNPFIECQVIARYLREHTTPDQTIAVLGSEPELFFEARRDSSTGYIYVYGLMEPQPHARRMQQEMIREIEAARPAYLVVVDIDTSWLAANDEVLIFDWMERSLAADFERVGVVDILSSTRTVYRWDQQAKDYEPRSRANLKVFRRKSSALPD